MFVIDDNNAAVADSYVSVDRRDACIPANKTYEVAAIASVKAQVYSNRPTDKSVVVVRIHKR